MNKLNFCGIGCFCLLLWSCLIRPSNQAEYHYTIQLKDNYPEITADSAVVTVKADDQIILKELHGPESLKYDSLEIVFTTGKNAIIVLEYEVFARKVLIIKKAHRFSRNEAVDRPEKSTVHKLDSTTTRRSSL